jgi:hypothetical protein
MKNDANENHRNGAVPEDISDRERRVPVGEITRRHTFRALWHRNYRLFFLWRRNPRK